MWKSSKLIGAKKSRESAGLSTGLSAGASFSSLAGFIDAKLKREMLFIE